MLTGKQKKIVFKSVLFIGLGVSGLTQQPINVGLFFIGTVEAREQQRGSTTLDQAVAKVRKESGGRIMSAEKTQENGVPVIRIKVLLGDGRVRTYRVDPRSGEFLR